MGVRIALKQPFPIQSPLNVCPRNLPLFDGGVSKDRGDSAMKEIQNPEVHPFPPDPQFIDAIPQQVSFRPSQLVTELTKPLDLHHALVLNLSGKRV
jgi:hypothetical protein